MEFGRVLFRSKRGPDALSEPVFSTAPSVPFFYFMRAYNRRFAQIARARRAAGRLGTRNDARRFLFQGYTFSPKSAFPIVRSTLEWACLELKEGWRSWFSSKSTRSRKTKVSPALSMPQPATVA